MKFRDRHERVDYLKACEEARRIVADPVSVEQARQFVATSMLADPHQRGYALIWQALLNRPPVEIAAALIEDSEDGRRLRETRPVFGRGLSSQDVVALLEQADAAAP